MKIVVCVKHVPDSTIVKYNIVTNTLENIRYVINPLDEVAVSAAIKIREQHGGEVNAISLGPQSTEDVLRTCLQMGVDNATHLCDESFDNIDTYSISVILAKQIAKQQPDLILCGSESMDESNGFVSAVIAESLGLPLITSVTRIDVFSDTNTAIVNRRLKGGDREIIETPLPAVLSVDSVLTAPLYPPLRTILDGKKKAITKLDAKSIGIDESDIEPTMTLVSISQPKPRLKKGASIDSNLSPHERMKLMMSGGVQDKGTSKVIEKPPQTAAAEIIQFLLNNEVISKEK